MMTRTGVGARDKTATYVPLNTFYGVDLGHDVSGRFLDDDENILDIKRQKNIEEYGIEYRDAVEDINVVRLSTYLLETVRGRRLPAKAAVITPRVLVKMDIEGAEYELLPDLIITGALRY